MSFFELRTNKEKTKKDIQSKIDVKLNTVDANYYATLYDFDYEDDVIAVSVHSKITDKETKFYFKKNENDFEILKIKGKKRPSLSNFLTLINSEINMWYDYAKELREAETIVYINICSVNSSFHLAVSGVCINIYYNKNHLTSDFRILSFYEGDKTYCKCKYDDIKTMLIGREMEFVKNVMVSVADCPKWMQEQLAIIRKEQIKEKEQKEQEEKAKQEKLAKKQKRRQFLKKIFTFVK